MVNTPIPASLKSEAKKAAKILREFTIPNAKVGPDKIIPGKAHITLWVFFTMRFYQDQIFLRSYRNIKIFLFQIFIGLLVINRFEAP